MVAYPTIAKFITRATTASGTVTVSNLDAKTMVLEYHKMLEKLVELQQQNLDLLAKHAALSEHSSDPIIIEVNGGTF